MHRISLGVGSRTIRLQHPMEAVYYVMSGTTAVTDPSTGQTSDLIAGSMALIDPGTPYTFIAGDDGAELVGGPCPADPAMYRHLEES